MANHEMITIDLLPEEQTLLLEHGYPFAPEKRQLEGLIARGGLGELSISPFYLNQMIGDLCCSINKCTRVRLLDRLDELYVRLEYIERTGDGSLDVL